MRAGDEAAARLLSGPPLPALRGKFAESDVVPDARLAAFPDVGDFEDRGDGSFGRRLRGVLRHDRLERAQEHLDTAVREQRGRATAQLGTKLRGRQDASS